MGGSQTQPVRLVGVVLNVLALALALTGLVVGWVLPRLSIAVTPIAGLSELLAKSGIDANTFLGAAITTLGVIIAVLIGYNVAGLQTIGQMLSLALVRAMLLSLAPFLLWWSITMGVALVYLLLPPIYLGQLWQILLWFSAVVLFMLGYLWSLPWRLSGEYAARWAIGNLRSKPIDRWEALDGYVVLQTGIASATARGDLGTVRAMALVLGGFLVGIRDRAAEAANQYDRGRYRALKNLLSGCAQHIGEATTTVSYNIGFITAGITLQATAIGHPLDNETYNLYSGLLRELEKTPERIDSLWTGVRHSACRYGPQGAPYLIEYWREHQRWDASDERRTERVAAGLLRLHRECLGVLSVTLGEESARSEAAAMLSDLYRYFATYLCDEALRERHSATRDQLLHATSALLDATHTQALATYPAWDATSCAAIITAYEKHHAQLLSALEAVR